MQLTENHADTMMDEIGLRLFIAICNTFTEHSVKKQANLLFYSLL